LGKINKQSGLDKEEVDSSNLFNSSKKSLKIVKNDGFEGFFVLQIFHLLLGWGEFGMKLFRKFIKDFDGLCFSKANDVAVNIICGADLCVSEIPGNDYQRGTVSNQKAGICVSQRMDAAGGETRTFNKFVHPLKHSK